MPRFEYQYNAKIDDQGRRFKRRLRLVILFLLISAVTAGAIYLIVPKGGKDKTADKSGQDLPQTEVSKDKDAAQTDTPAPSEPRQDAGSDAVKGDVPQSSGEKAADEVAETPLVSGEKENASTDVANDPILNGTAKPEKGKVWVGDPVNDVPEKAEAKNAVSVLEELKLLVEKKDFLQLDRRAIDIMNKENEGSEVYRTAAKYLLISRKNLLLSSDGVPGISFKYSIRGGDSLSRIARRNAATVAGLMRYNQLKNGRIRIGGKLVVHKGPWQITVSRKYRLLKLYNGGDKKSLFAVFEIGIGRLNSTPAGKFVISNRIKDPKWHAPDGRIFEPGEAGNELGKYFLKLAATDDPDRPLVGYGIHGTPDESTVGKSVSSGCIRMRNADVEILYELIPEGTPVVITD